MITPQGSISEFPVPTSQSQPSGIVSGPDGNLWFTEYLTNKVGRITPSGSIYDFPVVPVARQPVSIIVGPDANLWLTALNSTSIMRGQMR